MEDPSDIKFPIQWVGDMVSAPTAVNQALLIADSPGAGASVSDAHIVVLGFVAPPVLTEEMDRLEVERIASQALPVMVQGRFILSTSKLRELRDQLNIHLARHGEA